MKRAVVFLLVAPVSISSAATLLLIEANALRVDEFAARFALAAFIFTFLVLVFACGLDAWLERHLSVLPRVGLTAVGGAILAGGLSACMIGRVLPSAAIMYAAIGTGICAGMCSLLSEDFRN